MLEQDIEHENPELREAAAGCLHLLVSSASDERVLQVLGDGHPGVRQAALGNLLQQFPGDFREIALGWVLDNRGKPRAQQVLINHLQQTGLPDRTCEDIAGRKADVAGRLHDALTALASAPAPDNGTTALELLEQALRERLEQAIQLALLALSPLHEPGTIAVIRAGFSSGDIRHVANAIEALGNLENRRIADRLHAILQDSMGMTHREHTSVFDDLQSLLKWCLEQPDSWLRECARHALDNMPPEQHGA